MKQFAFRCHKRCLIKNHHGWYFNVSKQSLAAQQHRHQMHQHSQHGSTNNSSFTTSVEPMMKTKKTKTTTTTNMVANETKGLLDFESSQPFAKKSFLELVRAYCILKLTSYETIVKYSEKVS